VEFGVVVLRLGVRPKGYDFSPKSGQHGSRLKVHPPEKVSGARL